MQTPEEVQSLCDELRRFLVKEVDPRSRWIEENDAIPDDLLQKTRELGLFGLTIPEEYGGIGLDLAGKCAIEEVMGSTNYGFATLIGNHTGISTTGINALGNEAQKKKYLPRMATGEWIGCFALTEAEAGSDPAAMRTTAVKKGDRYILNGEKIYITNAPVASVFTLMAVTDKSKGVKGISAFILERGFKGLSVGRNELKMGMHGCTTSPVIMQDCEVPAENLLGPEGMGFVQALKTLTAGRVTVAARCCGMMDKLISRSAEYMKVRSQGGHKLAEYQGLQWMLADMAVQRDAARAADPARHRHADAWRAWHARSRDGETVCDRSARQGGRRGGADPRRHGLHARSGHRNHFPRCAHRAHLRRHVGDPAQYYCGADT